MTADLPDHSTLKPGRGRVASKRWLLLVGSVLLSLLVAELALQAYHRYCWWAFLAELAEDDEKPLVVPSDVPGLIYRFAPHVDQTNSQGYFDDEHALQKPAGMFRIVVIGDSLAAGQFVARSESFPRVLQTRLTQLRPGRRFEVIVLARSGYSTCQELILLRNEAFAYSPDLILWSYCLNDPAHPLYHAVAGDLAKVYQPPSYLLHFAAKGWFRLKESLAARRAPQEFHERLHDLYWEQVVENLHEIGARCQQQGVRAVFVLHPLFDSRRGFQSYRYRDLHRRLTDLATESGLLTVDLLQAYRGRTVAELGRPADPWHPNAEGHRVAGEFLAAWLLDEASLNALFQDHSQ